MGCYVVAFSYNQCVVIGPAIPIVAISLGITHEQYGTDDQYVVVLNVLSLTYTCTYLVAGLNQEKGHLLHSFCPL